MGLLQERRSRRRIVPGLEVRGLESMDVLAFLAHSHVPLSEVCGFIPRLFENLAHEHMFLRVNFP